MHSLEASALWMRARMSGDKCFCATRCNAKWRYWSKSGVESRQKREYALEFERKEALKTDASHKIAKIMVFLVFNYQ